MSEVKKQIFHVLYNEFISRIYDGASRVSVSTKHRRDIVPKVININPIEKMVVDSNYTLEISTVDDNLKNLITMKIAMVVPDCNTNQPKYNEINSNNASYFHLNFSLCDWNSIEYTYGDKLYTIFDLLHFEDMLNKLDKTCYDLLVDNISHNTTETVIRDLD